MTADNRTNEQIAIDALRVCGVTGHVNEDYASAMLEALCAAGRLATRVPVQGEPNDDRGLRTIAEGMKAAKEKLYEIGTGVGGLAVGHPELYEAYSKWDDLSDYDHADTVLALLDRLADRAAVPDAANRELTEAIRLTVEYVGNDMLPAIEGWDWYDALVKYAPEVAQAFVDKPIHFPKSAERDAALAAIERVRVVAFGHGKGAEDLPVDRDALKAALDGAPEPEWEREYRRVRPDGVPVFNAVFESLPVLDDYYTAEYRTVSPWLPVEGEKP